MTPRAFLPEDPRDRWILAGVGLLTITGLILRLYRLDFLSLWVDELPLAIGARDLARGEELQYTRAKVLSYTVSVLYRIFDPSVFLARLPNALFGTACIPLVYVLGKRLNGAVTGLVAALLATVSLYGTFWSRLLRDYSNFEMFYLILLIVFALAVRSGVREEAVDDPSNVFERWGLRRVWTLLLPVAFILSMANNTLSSFFIFSVGSYCSILAVIDFIRSDDPARFRSFNAIVFYLFVPAVLILFTPVFQPLAIQLLGVFGIAEETALRRLPDYDYLSTVWEQAPYEIFQRYRDVIATDLGGLSIVGLAGIALGFVVHRRLGAFLVAFFGVPFLLMSFIFRDPALPRYLIYLHPVFLIAIGVTVQFIVDRIRRARPSAGWTRFALPALLVLVLVLSPVGRTIAMITTDDHGEVVPMELSHWVFSNWKDPLTYVAERKQDGDVVVSTMKSAAKFYLDVPEAVWFRQFVYDNTVRNYVPRDAVNEEGFAAHSFEAFKTTVETNERGWLVADYYFYNVMTDPKARNYAIRTLDYHFGASPDGTVHVFSWDRSTPPPTPKAFLFEVGVNAQKMASPEVPFELPASRLRAETVPIALDVEGIDAREAVIVFNASNSAYITTPATVERTTVTMQVPSAWFVPGRNTVQFGYDPNARPTDAHPGFAVYNLQF